MRSLINTVVRSIWREVWPTHWYLAAQFFNRAIRQVKESVAALLQLGNLKPWQQVVQQLNRILSVGNHDGANHLERRSHVNRMEEGR